MPVKKYFPSKEIKRLCLVGKFEVDKRNSSYKHYNWYSGVWSFLDTPTRDERPDTPVTPSIPPVMPLILPTTPTAPTTIRSVPMHLFADIPGGARLSENNLNRAASSSTTPGAFAVSLLKYLFQELFTTDNLRVYFSYRGGGKLSKRPLDDTRNYVTAFYPSVTSESAYTAMVIEKINQFLRRPIQQKK